MADKGAMNEAVRYAKAKAAQNAKKIQPAPKPLPIPRPNPAGGKIRAKYRNQHPEGKAGDLF